MRGFGGREPATPFSGNCQPLTDVNLTWVIDDGKEVQRHDTGNFLQLLVDEEIYPNLNTYRVNITS